MGFVNREEGEFDLGEAGAEFFVGESLGSDVEEFEFSVFESCVECDRFVSGESGVKTGGGDAFCDQGIDLILHQGNEGGDDQSEAVEEEGRELIAKRLPSSGGEDGEGRAVGEDGVDDFFLTVAEGGVAEVFFEGFSVVHRARSYGFLWTGRR